MGRKPGLSFSLKTVGMVGDNYPYHWFVMSRLLLRSFRVVVREAKQGNKRLRDGCLPGIAMEQVQTLRVAAMLAAMSFECAFKGLLGHQMRGIPRGKDGHDLPRLARAAGLGLSGEDFEDLAVLTKMNQLGRYHKDVMGDSDFEISSTRIELLVKKVKPLLQTAMAAAFTPENAPSVTATPPLKPV